MSKSYDLTSYGSVRDRSNNDPNRQSTVVTNQPNTRSSQQLQTQSALDQQTRYNLYSEIEKLTVLNLDLKKQNENLIRELEKQSSLISRVPELEARCHELEKELGRKDTSLGQSLRDIDFLRKDLVSLQKIEPAYNEMFAHNKRLLSEIDDLNNQLERALSDRDRLENELNSLTGSHLKLNDALRRLDDLTGDNEEKKRELYNLREQSKQSSEKIRLLQYENDRMQNVYNDAQKEILYLTNKQNEIERGHQAHIRELEDKIESERRSAQQEKMDLTGKFLSDKAALESEINVTHQRAEELHNKLTLMVAENEKLHRLNLDANKEIENLNLKLYQTEIRAEEDKDKIERDKRVLLTSQEKDLTQTLANQKLRYEERIQALKNDIAELEKLKDLIKERENEIDNLKHQMQQNDRAWERKLAVTLDTEKDNMVTKHSIERNDLANELTQAKARIADLEKQLNLMTIEVDRLANLHEEKDQEIHDLKNHHVISSKEHDASLDELRDELINQKLAELSAQEKTLTETYEAQLQELQTKNKDLEDKVLALAEHNQTLNQLHDEKDQALEEHRYQIEVQEQKHSQILQDVEDKHKSQLHFSTTKEIQSGNQKLAAEAAKYDQKIADLNKEIARLKDKIKHFEAEVARLNGIIEDKHIEVHEVKATAADFEAQKAQEIADLHEHLEILRNANVDVLNSKTRFDAERASLLSQIQQEKIKIDELNRRIQLLLEQIDNLNGVIDQKTEECSNARKELVRLHDETDREKTALQAEIADLKDVRYENQELKGKFQGEVTGYENQIRQLKTLNENNKEQLDKLYELLGERKKELDFQVKMNNDLRVKLEEQKEQIRKTDSHSQATNDKYEGLSKRTDELKKERDYLSAKLEKLDIELNQANADLRRKIEDLDVVKKKYEKSLEMSTQLNAQLMNKIQRNE